MTCPQSDNVVAVFLDGDAQRDTQQDANVDLAQHLAACPDCQRALALARRLDAALASSSGLAVEPELAHRLLEKAVVATSAPTMPPAATAPGLRVRPLPLAVAAATLLLAGIGLGRLLVPASQPEPAPQTAASSPEPEGFVPLPLGAGPGQAPRILLAQPRRNRTPEHLVLARVLRNERPPLMPLVLPALALAQILHGGGLAQELHRLQDHVREQAGRKLLQSHRASARRELIAYLAAAPQDRVLERLRGRAVADSGFLAFVRSELRRDPDGPALGAAARLAERGLDRLLRGLCRGQPARSHQLAAALATIERRPGRADLLLDLWQGLQDRGLAADANRLAERWFVPLPAVTTLELVAAAQATGKAGRRRQCILALAARRDPQALPYLLELVAGPHRGDAVAAAHALGQLPATAVDTELVVGQSRSRRPQLLLAALASMRSPRVQARIQAMELTDTERQFLATGRFNPQQFTLAARLFRERRRLTD